MFSIITVTVKMKYYFTFSFVVLENEKNLDSIFRVFSHLNHSFSHRYLGSIF